MKKRRKRIGFLAVSAVVIQLVSAAFFRHEITIGGEIFIPAVAFLTAKLIREIVGIFRKMR